MVVLVVAYTELFLLRAIAWRVLSPGRIGICHVFVSMTVVLLAKHILSVKVDKLVHLVLAVHDGMPKADAANTTALARYQDFEALVAIAAVVGTTVSLTTGADHWLKGLALPSGVILACGATMVVMRFSRINTLQNGPAAGPAPCHLRAISRRALECAENINDYNYAQVQSWPLTCRVGERRQRRCSFHTPSVQEHSRSSALNTSGVSRGDASGHVGQDAKRQI